MSMFCYQCQEAAKGTGCTGSVGVCGIKDEAINLQDLSVYLLKGLSLISNKLRGKGKNNIEVDRFITDTLFATITNANFTTEYFIDTIQKSLELRENLKKELKNSGGNTDNISHDSTQWSSNSFEDFQKKAANVGSEIDAPDEDTRSLRALVLYGLKGVAAYMHHAYNLGYEDQKLYAFMQKALASLTDDSISMEDNIAMVLETGEIAVAAMALLDKANTESYGNPEITEVNIGVGKNPGILISGHDLKDMEELLKQTDGTGIDVYTHSEMLPANYYPEFKKYKHFVGNYGNAWWQQDKEFNSFNGPILMTTNCITPVKKSYAHRIFTTGVVGYPEVKHISSDTKDGKKDFSEIIKLAKECKPPTEIEKGKIIGGFAHDQVMKLADKVVDAVKSGAIKRFIVMAGCDGRHKTRNYFTDLANNLPDNAVILTAGCAKYRYNKLELGDIGGIPRVLDAGQCNDSYSLALIALKLKEVFELNDINDLPISFDIAWYEQKAVAVLLALLHLGVKGIRLGPTLPAFLSPNVAKILVDTFGIKPIGEPLEDIEAMMLGK